MRVENETIRVQLVFNMERRAQLIFKMVLSTFATTILLALIAQGLVKAQTADQTNGTPVVSNSVPAPPNLSPVNIVDDRSSPNLVLESSSLPADPIQDQGFGRNPVIFNNAEVSRQPSRLSVSLETASTSNLGRFQELQHSNNVENRSIQPLVETERNDNKTKVDVHVPIFFDMTHQREPGSGRNKLDLSVMHGLVTVNHEKIRNPSDGRLEGPIRVTVFGIPVYWNGRRFSLTQASPEAQPRPLENLNSF